MNTTTKLLMGIPRSGTTLCCHLLNQVHNTVALHEPIPVAEFVSADRAAAVHVIRRFAETTRAQLNLAGIAVSKQADGKIPANPVTNDSVKGLRSEQVTPGFISADKPLSDEFTLVIKHNALFTSLLEQIVQEFPCYAIVRNPLATLASWQTVDLPVQRGRVPMGEKFDTVLADTLDHTETCLDRQLQILAWFYERFTRCLAPRHIIRYEDIIETHGESLTILSNEPVDEGSGWLENRNASTHYRHLDIDQLMSRLISEPAVYERFYSVKDLELLADNIRQIAVS